MFGFTAKRGRRTGSIAIALGLVLTGRSVVGKDDPSDWPSYNRDFVGSRHNPAETTLKVANVATPEEKWRFPAKDSDREIGVVHATPIGVGGYVGTGNTLFNPMDFETYLPKKPTGEVHSFGLRGMTK